MAHADRLFAAARSASGQPQTQGETEADAKEAGAAGVPEFKADPAAAPAPARSPALTTPLEAASDAAASPKTDETEGVAEGGAGVAVVSHAARMRASPCFQESVGTAAPLECTTCHDPHRGFEARPAGARSAACLDCHDAGLADAVPAALRADRRAPGPRPSAGGLPGLEIFFYLIIPHTPSDPGGEPTVIPHSTLRFL